jgi:hypothetical protein
MAAPIYDSGQAGFSTSAGARNVINGMNPLSPGGMNPQNTHLPTLGWAIAAIVAVVVFYHFVIRK